MAYEKSGQVGGTVSAVIQLIVGVGVATLVMIFVGTLGGQTFELVEDDLHEIGSRSANATSTALWNQSVSFGNDEIHTGSLNCLNATNNVQIGLGNFTIDYDLGNYTTAVKGYVVNNTNIICSYSHGTMEIQSAVKGSIVSSFDALEQTGNYMPIIVLAVVITLVMGLVLVFAGGMGGKSNGGGGSAL
jgi:hypothetical protein